MKQVIRTILCITLCLSLAFGTSAISAQGISDTFSSFWDSVVRFFSIIIGDISDLIEGGYTKVDMNDFTADGFDMPGLDSGFVPQGLCYNEAYGVYLISGYTDDGNSRIYIVNKSDNQTKEIILRDFTAHAGGIASHGDSVWISSGGNAEKGGYLYRFDMQTILSADNSDELGYDSKFQTIVKGSFLGCSDDMIWVGEFYTPDGGYEVNPSHALGKNHAWACGYRIGEESLELTAILSVPDEVQGITVMPDNSVAFSISYGRYNDSKLEIFPSYTNLESSTVSVDGKDVPLYNCQKADRVAKIEMPALMQGIEYVNGDVCVIYESGAQKYSQAKQVIRTAHIIDYDALLKEIG